MKLASKVILVSGGAAGIGQAVSQTLAREGATVIIADIDIVKAGETVVKINADGGEAHAIRTDIRQFQEVATAVAKINRDFGNIDILVNVAGGSPHATRSQFCDSSEKNWDTVIGVNLFGTMICTRNVINQMIKNRAGKIINIGSIAGIMGTAGLVDYSVAKGGVILFTKALAKEVAQYGITVNCVCPGPTASEYFLELPEETKRNYLKTVPLGRFCTPAEIAALVLYVASAEADMITGQTIVIDGGRVLGQ